MIERTLCSHGRHGSIPSPAQVMHRLAPLVLRNSRSGTIPDPSQVGHGWAGWPWAQFMSPTLSSGARSGTGCHRP